MNLQKIKDHFPEYSDMKIGEFYKYMHKTYYPDMKITDMYRALLKLTQIIKKEEVKEDPKAEEVKEEPEVKPKEDDSVMVELKEKIEILTRKIEAMNEKPKEEEEETEEVDKDLDKIMVKTKAVHNDRIITIEVPAKEALKDNKEDIDTISEMMDCLNDMESLKDVLKKHKIPKEYGDKVIKNSKQLQKKQDKTELEADKLAIKQLKKIYEKEKESIEEQIGGA